MTKFSELLKYAVEKKESTEKHIKANLAKKLDVSASYISGLLTGKDAPPTFERCKKIAEILGLKGKDYVAFMHAAGVIRIKEENQDFIPYLNPNNNCLTTAEISEALQNPAAVKALLLTHRGDKTIKDAILAILETLPQMAPEKRAAIIALCR